MTAMSSVEDAGPFGSPCSSGDAAPSSGAGTVKGKLGYVAPEQLRGQRVDARADLFAVGVILFELLTARRLFHRKDDGATMGAVLSGEVPAIAPLRPACPALLEEAIRRALARDRRAASRPRRRWKRRSPRCSPRCAERRAAATSRARASAGCSRARRSPRSCARSRQARSAPVAARAGLPEIRRVSRARGRAADRRGPLRGRARRGDADAARDGRAPMCAGRRERAQRGQERRHAALEGRAPAAARSTPALARDRGGDLRRRGARGQGDRRVRRRRCAGERRRAPRVTSAPTPAPQRGEP